MSGLLNMFKLKVPFKRAFKWGMITFLSLIVTIIISVLASLYLLHHQSEGHLIADWIRSNNTELLLWRLSLLALIFICWPCFVRYRLRHKRVSASTLTTLINQRYLIVLALISIDILLHLF